MKEERHKSIFSFKQRYVFDESLSGLLELLISNPRDKYCIFFEFRDIKKGLKNLKELILKHKQNIDFRNIYFYNANDFVNFVLPRPVYLPNNINLFINSSCVIGCKFCENKNRRSDFLPLSQIKLFLSQYNIGDNINFNILGQGDPLFHPELLSILEYLKSLGGNITFFSGGKALLFSKDIDALDHYVDEFKINLSSSNTEVYNSVHDNNISEQEFLRLCSLLKKIAYKTTLLTVLMKENLQDLLEYYKFGIKLGVRGLEVKKNLQYPKNDILDNDKILLKVTTLLEKIKQRRELNVISNIAPNLTHFIKTPEFYTLQKSLLDELLDRQLVNSKNSTIDIDNMESCYQFGHSIDIIEKKKVAVCCAYDVSIVSDIKSNFPYYDSPTFIQKMDTFRKQTPEACKKCPMPVDRYKNITKFHIVDEL